jgi:hypothetical protein
MRASDPGPQYPPGPTGAPFAAASASAAAADAEARLRLEAIAVNNTEYFNLFAFSTSRSEILFRVEKAEREAHL